MEIEISYIFIQLYGKTVNSTSISAYRFQDPADSPFRNGLVKT